MDFIERWFGLSPDGGDGSTEALYIFAAVIIITLVLARRRVAGLAQRWLDRRAK
jgi:hypothetical protein